MPPLDSRGQYVAEIFRVLGPAKAGGFGMLPLEWSDILGWRDAVDAQIDGFEIEAIVFMSRAYCSESGRSSKENEPNTPPYQTEGQGIRMGEVISDRFKRGFRSRKRKK